MKIDGEVYTVKDTSGHDVQLHVTKQTLLEGSPFVAGDKVEAHVTQKGEARSLFHVTASGKMSTSGSKIVEGDILKTDGEYYTVHDRSGHEVRLHVDQNTRLEDGGFKVGDKIEAYVTEKGHARALYHIKAEQPVS